MSFASLDVQFVRSLVNCAYPKGMIGSGSDEAQDLAAIDSAADTSPMTRKRDPLTIGCAVLARCRQMAPWSTIAGDRQAIQV